MLDFYGFRVFIVTDYFSSVPFFFSKSLLGCRDKEAGKERRT